MTNLTNVEKDLVKWLDKINALILCSGEGECPQCLKAIATKILIDGWNKIFESKNEEEYIKHKANILQWLNENGSFNIVKNEKKN
jgi:hypothetical protein